MKQAKSLFRRMLLGFFGVMLLIWLVTFAWYFIASSQLSNKHQTRSLQMTADWILIQAKPGLADPNALSLSAKRIEQLQNEFEGEMGMYKDFKVQIWLRGHLLYGSSGLPTILPVISETGPAATLNAGGTWLSWVSRDTSAELTVRVAQCPTGGPHLSSDNLGTFMLPLVFCLPFLLIPAWFIIGIGLRPLKHIVTQIEERSSANLMPLAPSPYRELSPLVVSVNQLMCALDERLKREQVFLTDAAHELKTPLAIIQINADTLSTTQEQDRMTAAHRGLSEGVARATHTVHQLLALARSDADAFMDNLTMFDLSALLCDRIALAVPLATRRQIEIELLAPDQCMITLHHETAALLIDNLIDNAIKYSPDGACVSVTLARNDNGVQLLVSDAGPGIAPALRALVFERFYRLPGLTQSGSGLGLAIAATAARRNNATIQLDNGVNGVGLMAKVDFHGRDEK